MVNEDEYYIFSKVPKNFRQIFLITFENVGPDLGLEVNLLLKSVVSVAGLDTIV